MTLLAVSDYFLARVDPASGDATVIATLGSEALDWARKLLVRQDTLIILGEVSEDPASTSCELLQADAEGNALSSVTVQFGISTRANDFILLEQGGW